MAVDLDAVCELAQESPGIELATTMAVLFSLYTICAVLVASLAIYTASERSSLEADAARSEQGMKAKTQPALFAFAGGETPQQLVSLPRTVAFG